MSTFPKGIRSARKIRNADLCERLDALLESRPPGAVLLRKVKGHATAADVAAGRVTAADRTRVAAIATATPWRTRLTTSSTKPWPRHSTTHARSSASCSARCAEAPAAADRHRRYEGAGDGGADGGRAGGGSHGV